jgi:hypothetical protein
VRSLAISILAAALAACSPNPPRAVHPAPDPVKEAWYGETVDQVAGMAREAETSLSHGAADQAAATVTKGQPLIHRLLSVPRPTLPAMEAVSDLDQIYGQMLLGNRHYVWARVLFQKNVTRWTLWQPQTPDTLRRLQIARAALAECDRHID